jgi:hypothetical protein
MKSKVCGQPVMLPNKGYMSFNVRCTLPPLQIVLILLHCFYFYYHHSFQVHECICRVCEEEGKGSTVDRDRYRDASTDDAALRAELEQLRDSEYDGTDFRVLTWKVAQMLDHKAITTQTQLCASFPVPERKQEMT